MSSLVSGIIGKLSRDNVASKPIGSQPGATGAVAKLSEAVSVANLDPIAQLKETLETSLQTLKHELQSVPAATPDNLQQVLASIEDLKVTANTALTAATQLTSPGTSNTADLQRLMMHYPSQYSADGMTGKGAELMLAIKRQALSDWAEDIAEYPGWVVAAACKQWRRSEQGRFRPSISEFRQLCGVLLWPTMEKKLEAERALTSARRKAEFEAECEKQRRERYELKPRSTGTLLAASGHQA